MDSYLQELNRAFDADPCDLQAATRLIAAQRRVLAGQEVYRYRYRSLPCNIQPDEKLWCIVGGDGEGGGVLEWCYDREDAETRLKMMEADPRFSMLRAVKYWPDCAWCSTPKHEQDSIPGLDGRRFCNEDCKAIYCEDFGTEG